MNKATIFWFRRDLRLHDNVGLFHALSKSNNVYPIFIFDKDIIKSLNKDDYRLSFIIEQIKLMNEKLQEQNSKIESMENQIEKRDKQIIRLSQKMLI